MFVYLLINDTILFDFSLYFKKVQFTKSNFLIWDYGSDCVFHAQKDKTGDIETLKKGPGENRTRIARFRVLSDNHYTTGPPCGYVQTYCLKASG